MNCKNYCDNKGNCTRCGNCCASCIPLTKEEENSIREYIKKNNIEPEYFQNENNMNLKCCFYDCINKVCKIYEVRPSICRSFKCNRNITDLEKEREENHKKAYWNKMIDGVIKNVTDMRLLFYGDPRSLVGNIIYAITDGTMECNEKQIELLKKILKEKGQERLANCIEGDFV